MATRNLRAAVSTVLPHLTGKQRQALADSAKIAIKTRQHLAAIKPQERGLMLVLMHFPDELLDAFDFKSPAAATPGKPEMAMAKKLIDCG